MESQSGWSCPVCKSLNLFEDRFCGECGAPRNSTIVTPVIRAPETVTGLLPDVAEAPAAAWHGTLLVIAAGLIGAAAFGALYHVVTRAFDVMVLFPILLGAALGGALRLASVRGRCRRAALLVPVAVLAGLAAYGLRQTLDVLHERDTMRRVLAARTIDPPLYTFSQALSYRAERGIAFGSGKGTLTGAGFWIFLAVEAALAAAVAAAAVAAMSRMAYCTRCRHSVPSVPVYRVNGADGARLADAVRRQRWKVAQEMTNRAAPTRTDRAEAALLKCGSCDISSIRVDVYAGRRFKKVMHVALPSDSLKELARSA